MKEFLKIGNIVKYKYDDTSIYERMIIDRYDIQTFINSSNQNHLIVLSIKNINGDILYKRNEDIKLNIYICTFKDEKTGDIFKDNIFSKHKNLNDVYKDAWVQRSLFCIPKKTIEPSCLKFEDLANNKKMKYNQMLEYYKAVEGENTDDN